MKKVLIITYVELFPVNAGNRRRITDMIEILRNNDFDVYCLQFNVRANGYYKRKMEQYFGEGKYFSYAGYDYGYKLRRKMREELDRSIYYSVDEMVPKGLMGFTKKLNTQFHFDVVISEYVMSSKLLKVFDKRTLKIIDTHDVLTDRNKIFEKLGVKPTGIYLRKYQEIKGLSRADVILAIQSAEADTFRNWLGRNVRVVMTGNVIKPVAPCVSRSRNILFVGSGNHLNLIGAKWFIENVIPLLDDQDVNVQFAGKVCNGIPDSKNYVKLGFVDDLGELYRTAQIVINPIQGGTGLNIKTIEALGYSKPMVSTSIGAKGLPHPEKYMKIADDPRNFTDMINELLNNPEECQRLSKQAYRFIKKYNEICIERLLDVVSG